MSRHPLLEGVTCIATHHNGESLEQMMRRADQALYQAKGAGLNTIVRNPSYGILSPGVLGQ